MPSPTHQTDRMDQSPNRSETFDAVDAAGPVAEPSSASRIGRRVGRIALGASLVFAGISHLTFAREDFQAQVPAWQPFDPDFVVVASGVVEIALGTALIVSRKYRPHVGWLTAAFFVAIYPGNISQLVNQVDSLGLDTDLKRWIRMPFQPVLVVWALWSTSAWRAWRSTRADKPRAQ